MMIFIVMDFNLHGSNRSPHIKIPGYAPVDHYDRDCEKWIESDGTLDSKEREYGPWIQVAPTQAR